MELTKNMHMQTSSNECLIAQDKLTIPHCVSKETLIMVLISMLVVNYMATENHYDEQYMHMSYLFHVLKIVKKHVTNHTKIK